MFSPKDFIPESLKSRVVYQFTRASCGARYIGETISHFHTRVNEHLFRDKNSLVFKHLNCSRHCRDSCDASSFKIIDFAKTFSQLKIKESFHIERLKPELNKHKLNMSLYFYTLKCVYFSLSLLFFSKFLLVSLNKLHFTFI